MRESLDTRTNFAALWSPLESIRKAGVHEPFTKDLKSRLDLTYDPEQRYLPNKKNLEMLNAIVREVLRKRDEVTSLAKAGLTSSPENEAERVAHNVNRMLRRFGAITYPNIAALLNEHQLIEYVKTCLIATFSRKMTRQHIATFIQKKLLSYL
jgi:hypothetical protein